MHQTLYRKWRPSTFDEVSGQSHIVDILKYEVANKKTSHAYLFCGSRGTGKTSCAKILSKAVNCENPKDGNPCGECEACRAIAEERTTDVLEMDAASNNGVDYIRDIRDAVIYPPSMLGYRVYIIDEVHMLSSAAFNALLKTLEEPPSRVIFILATTEVNKVPITVVSRCQRFDFRRISVADITSRLMYIAKEENIDIEESAARVIARLSRGGMRDAISLLELCAGENKKIDVSVVTRAAGVSSRDSVERTLNAVFDSDRKTIFEEISNIYKNSLDVVTFWQSMMEYTRDLMVVKTNADACEYLELMPDEVEELKKTADKVTFDKLVQCAEMLDAALTNLQKGTFDNRVIAEMTLIRLASHKYGNTVKDLALRVGEIEKKLQGASVVQRADAKTENKKETKVEKEKAETETETVENQKTNEETKKRLSCWADIVESVSLTDMLTGALLKKSTAFCDDENKVLYVYMEPFAKSSFENSPGADRLVLDALYEYKNDGEYSLVICEKTEDQKEELTPEDELLN